MHQFKATPLPAWTNDSDDKSGSTPEEIIELLRILPARLDSLELLNSWKVEAVHRLISTSLDFPSLRNVPRLSLDCAAFGVQYPDLLRMLEKRGIDVLFV